MSEKDQDRTKKLLSLYLGWLIIFGASFAAGGYTLGLLMDFESVGTANSPNNLQAAEDFGLGGEFTNNGGFFIPEPHGNNEAPNAEFDIDSVGNSDNYELDASASSDPDGTVEEYRWYFGNDGTLDATGEDVGPRQFSVGELIRLIVVDNEGAADEETKRIGD